MEEMESTYIIHTSVVVGILGFCDIVIFSNRRNILIQQSYSMCFQE